MGLAFHREKQTFMREGFYMGTELNRRSFLKGGLALGAVAATAGLTACSGGSGSGSASAASASAAASGSAGSASASASAAAFAVGDKLAQGAAKEPKALVDPTAEWELVANVPDTGILEGMNWHDDTLWFIDVASSRIFKLDGDEVVTVYEDPDHKAMPNGAKFINDDTMLLCDRALGLCTYTLSTGKYEVKVDSYNGEKFLGLNDLVLDGQGGVYFTDPGQSDYFNPVGSVYYLNYAAGDYNAIEKIVSRAAYPNGITISPDGMFLYVAEFNTNSIILVPSKLYTAAKDTPYVFARYNGGHGPDGVLTDADGNVYAAHLNAQEVAIVDNAGWPMAPVRLPDGATPLVSNLLIADGYLYVCEFGGQNIWRIPIEAQPNPIA